MGRSSITSSIHGWQVDVMPTIGEETYSDDNRRTTTRVSGLGTRSSMLHANKS